MRNVKQTRLSADVGGTFTDIVPERDGRRWTTKVLTTRAEPEQGVLSGVRAAAVQQRHQRHASKQ